MNGKVWAPRLSFSLSIFLFAVASVAEEPQFRQTLVAEELNQPVALAFAPDGDLYVAQKGGEVLVLRNGSGEPEPFFSMTVHTNVECGMAGIAIDPDYVTNGYVYVCATVTASEQQIIRVRAENGMGVEPTVIRGNLPTRGDYHNSGCLRIGEDNKLYVSIGDNFDPIKSQMMNTLAGKILRLNLDGSIPEDNPFQTRAELPRMIWAMGFRNPFRFEILPGGRLAVLDVGSEGDARQEEVNIVYPGDNGGWPTVEGDFDQQAHPTFLHPLISYRDIGTSPSGACYYTGSGFPREYYENLFYADWTGQWIRRIVLDGDQLVLDAEFVTTNGRPTDLVQGPDGALYYPVMRFGANCGCAIYRIEYAAAEEPKDPDASPMDPQDPPDDGQDKQPDPPMDPPQEPNSDNPPTEQPNNNENGDPPVSEPNDGPPQQGEGNSNSNNNNNNNGSGHRGPSSVCPLISAAALAMSFAGVGWRRRGNVE